MTLRIVALLVGLGFALYRHFRHHDEWGAYAFYGLMVVSLVDVLTGMGGDAGPDYSGLRRDR